MGKRIDLTGMRQGKLTIIRPGKYEKGERYWVCKCDCGNETEIRQWCLRYRKQQSCGCLKGSALIGRSQHDDSHIGERYGMLTIVAFHEAKQCRDARKGGREAIWECKCDCGNTAYKTMHYMKKSKNPSCGCFLENNGHKKFQYEIGEIVETKHSGFVIADRFRKIKKNSRSHEKYYVCECLSCHEKTVILENVLAKKSGSCHACSKTRSFPEKYVYWFFKQLSIEFETEYSPEWSGRLRYDFSFVKDNIRYVVEIDGLDHFSEKTRRKDLTLKDIQETDRQKDEMAKSHGCEVVRLDCRYSNSDYIISSIKESLLNKLFDLSNVDWNYCLTSWRGNAPRLANEVI